MRAGRHRLVARCVGLAVMVLFAAVAVRAETPAPPIAVAADLQFAVGEIAAAFTAETAMRIKLATGSTGNFARQIREGAPFQMFMAADEAFIMDLYRDGFTRDAGEPYAAGRIVVMVPLGSPLTADGHFRSLKRAFGEGTITRFAIANPDHAPYGMRAREALQHAGLWEAIQPFLVLGENVSQTAQFALSGNAQGGIIAYSLALAPNVKARGTFDLIPDAWHQPLRQRMVLLKNAGPIAEAFYAYMQTPSARTIMKAYGFMLPGDVPGE